MLKLNRSIALLMTTSFLALSTPSLARADEHGEGHGPMPIAALGSLFGGVIWVASLPFSVLIAPRHVVDGFDLLVATPWRVAVGAQEPQTTGPMNKW